MINTIKKMSTVLLMLIFLCCGHSLEMSKEIKNKNPELATGIEETANIEQKKPVQSTQIPIKLDNSNSPAHSLTEQSNLNPKPTLTRQSGNTEIKKPSTLNLQSSEEIKPADSLDRRPQLGSRNLVSLFTHTVLALSGVYVAFVGFRVFRLLIIILGFYVAYYGILILMAEAKLYDAESISHQLGLLVGSIILGLVISITTYMLEKINFIVLGAAISSVVTLFYAQFCADLSQLQDRIVLLSVYAVATFLFAITSFKFMDHVVIIGSAIVGSIVTPISVGVLIGDFLLFQERSKPAFAKWEKLRVYMFVCGLSFLSGMLFQYLLRKRLLDEIEQENLDQIRKTSFLN